MTLGRDLISSLEENCWANEASKPEALAFVNSSGLCSSIFVTPPSHHPQHQNVGLPVCSGGRMTPIATPFPDQKGRCWPHTLVGPSSALVSALKTKPFIFLDPQSPASDNTMSQGCGPRRCVTSPLLYIPFPCTLPATENLEKRSL